KLLFAAGISWQRATKLRARGSGDAIRIYSRMSDPNRISAIRSPAATLAGPVEGSAIAGVPLHRSRDEEWDMDHRDVVTRLTVAALLAGLIGTAAVMAQSDGPPPRTFGSDTTAVGVFTGQDTTAPGLQCDAPLDVSIPLECSGFLASGLDGTLLDVTVRVPQTAGLHPLIVYVHGWGGSKNAGHQYDDVLAGAGKADAARRTRGGGYTYLRYSTRGFGKSWGQTNFGDVDVELADLRSMVGQVVDDPRL